MDILILGNGFDLAHGLKTKYIDFLEYCAKQLSNILTYKPSDPYYTNMWVRHFINVQSQLGENWIDLEREIYNVIKYISSVPVLNKKDYSGHFSIDFNDFTFNFYNFNKYISETLGKPEESPSGYFRYYKDNCVSYQVCFSNRKGIIKFLYDQLRNFTSLFEKYLLNEVLATLSDESEFQLSLQSIGVCKGNKDVHVLSFNYTDTCERLYKHKFNTYCKMIIKPVYVHGKAEEGRDDLVLGTYSFDSNLNQTNKNIPVDFNIFKKHYQRHKFGTIEKYQDLYQKIKKSRSVPKFHIIGHSLDDTDTKILKHILLANPNSIINIYYHDDEAQERLMKNIDSIIGEDEVMAKVRFIDQHDAKRGILKLKNI